MEHTERIGLLGINPDAYGVWAPDDPGTVSWRRFLDTSATAGFQGVELGPDGYLPADPAVLADELGERNLRLLCGYLPAWSPRPDANDDLPTRLEAVATLTTAAGADHLLVLARTGWGDDGRQVLDSMQWESMVKTLRAVQREVWETHGLRTVFHPHVGMAVESEDEVLRLLADTEGELSLCLDIGQFAYAGGDPEAFIRQHADVVAYVHLRDLDPVVRDQCVDEVVPFHTAAARGVFCEPGRGSVDFAAVVDALRAQRFDGPLVVERSLLGAHPDDACAAAERAFAFYAALGLGSRAP